MDRNTFLEYKTEILQRIKDASNILNETVYLTERFIPEGCLGYLESIGAIKNVGDRRKLEREFKREGAELRNFHNKQPTDVFYSIDMKKLDGAY
jgi:hypothetical protein